FQVYAVREEPESKNVKFVLSSSLQGWPTLQTGFFEDVYDNQVWNFAVRSYADKTNNGGSVKGGVVNDSVSGSVDDVSVYVEFYGVNTVLDHIMSEFHVSGAMTFAGAATDPSNTANKRIYVGAHRTNFTGSVVTRADTLISSVRYWNSYLSNVAIKAHAKDASNYGTEHPYENIGFNKTSLSSNVPAMESLVLHWDFDTVTGSGATGTNSTGDFIVSDYSSGSTDTASRYGWLGNLVKTQHAGKGDFFPTDSSNVVSTEYIYSAKQRLPDVISSDDMVNILDRDDEAFTREKRPIRYFFAIEKSMYQTISEEMINFFATIVDFNNLIGEPVNRYRHEYKKMGKIRQLFYEKVRNTPNLEKYINFYKWIDSSISDMILKLVPASADMSEKLSTLIESHALERNKYWTKYPTLEFKKPEPEVSLRGITELVYDWKHGHYPLTGLQADNCFWWQERAKASNIVITSGDSEIDAQRNIFNEADRHRSGSAPNTFSDDGTSYAGSTYAINRFTKPYRLGLERSKQVHGGVNFHENKKLDYVNIATEIFGSLVKPLMGPDLLDSGITASINYLLVRSSEVERGINVCNDDYQLYKKRKYRFDVKNSREANQAAGYSHGKGDLLLPFNIHSSSIVSGYLDEVAASKFASALESPIDFTNIHIDTYGFQNETPMQSPFTEKFVGGRQHRHVDVNQYDSSLSTLSGLQDMSTRPEAWYIILGDGDPEFGIVGPTYTTTGKHDKDVPRATRMRQEYAKRPVNIRNIQQTTGSGVGTHIGNYESNWNVVSTAGRTQNNAFFKENGGVSLPNLYVSTLPKTTNAHTLVAVVASPTPGESGNTFSPPPSLDGTLGAGNLSGRFSDGTGAETIFTLPRRDLTGSNSVIVSRFSAPGGPEVMSRGYLDINAEEYSVHNVLPFRNLSVRGSGSGEDNTIRMSIIGSTSSFQSTKDREGLRTRLTRHCGRFGHDSQWGSPEASYHKINRNRLKRIKET
ncbi:hypothetical protein CMI37_16905, partial [Candidatus Pacearchaeota archaeon]|nr:hypothetical protein [Candidatus Pacearchaeota archaeon]